MKQYLLLAACLAVITCNAQQSDNREATRPQTARNEPTATLRWAFANKREIDNAIFQWSRDKMEAAKKKEALPPETEQKVQEYEVLQRQLMYKEMEGRGFRMPVRAGLPDAPASDETYETLSNRVARARAPIADILERRNRLTAEFRDQFSTENLVAEYVKDRFDLVVDSSDEHSSRSVVLYRASGDAIDITDGVIKLFKEKTKH